IFIDPDPDPAVSFAERERLFALPKSSWGDYDRSLISAGGGVFPRHLKSIKISPQMQERFAIEADRMAPDELINALLKSPVQLIWNGGIGTYVKAHFETHTDVGDRANDHLRVDARELRAIAFGEGGNLGMTQRARIEFSLAGGAVNTDFIDNSAGVDCSDHEVNIKILLNEVVARQDMTLKQRNTLLGSMTDAVAELVLTNNRNQARTLSLASRHAQHRASEYQRFITRMETASGLDRALEYLPTDEELIERVGLGRGLTRPELAVLLAYSKIHLKNTLSAAGVHRDPTIAREALRAFPEALVAGHEAAILQHRLLPEIVASQLANAIVDSMGITFAAHLMEYVGGKSDAVAKAYLAFSESFGLREWMDAVAAASSTSENIRLDLMLEISRLGRSATRWILRHHRDLSSVGEFVERYRSRTAELIENRHMFMSDIQSQDWSQAVAELVAESVPEPLARHTARAVRLSDALPIIDAADQTGAPAGDVAKVYVELSQTLGLDWLSEQLAALSSTSHWQAMERDALLDDVKTQQGVLAGRVLTDSGGSVSDWIVSQERFAGDWRAVMADAQHASVQEFSMYAMTCRKLGDLCRSLR
ncbi:MAG: NAD-glutamate dehydrogenase, partial [Pseudomonadales bacterium]|nr:NAD-glutamate dehydrogenase [Pseudomonadales bacterium]